MFRRKSFSSTAETPGAFSRKFFEDKTLAKNAGGTAGSSNPYQDLYEYPKRNHKYIEPTAEAGGLCGQRTGSGGGHDGVGGHGGFRSRPTGTFG
jgi:hypothetical protein